MEAVNEVRPRIGMSVSMGIGSDSYHEIIVKMERNTKTIYTMLARQVLGGVSLEDWNAAPESIKAKRAADALESSLIRINQLLNCPSEQYAMAEATSCYTYRNAGRWKGRYVEKGNTCCVLRLDNQREYLDPSF